MTRVLKATAIACCIIKIKNFRKKVLTNFVLRGIIAKRSGEAHPMAYMGEWWNW